MKVTREKLYIAKACACMNTEDLVKKIGMPRRRLIMQLLVKTYGRETSDASLQLLELMLQRF